MEPERRYTDADLEFYAALGGPPSEDESTLEKIPCPNSYGGQSCFALRNKSQWQCVYCGHEPFAGCNAGMTVYIKGTGQYFCALCLPSHLLQTNQIPCKGKGCEQERARCARMMLSLRKGQHPAAEGLALHAPPPPPGIHPRPVNVWEGNVPPVHTRPDVVVPLPLPQPSPAVNLGSMRRLPSARRVPRPPPQPVNVTGTVTVRHIDVPQPQPLQQRVVPKPPIGIRSPPSAVSTQTEIDSVPGAAASSTDGGLTGAPAPPRNERTFQPLVYLCNELAETRTALQGMQNALRDVQREVKQLRDRVNNLETTVNPEWEVPPVPVVECRTLSHSMPLPSNGNQTEFPRRLYKSLPAECKV